MNNIIKSILLITCVMLMGLICADLFLDAWDNTMSDEEIAYYLERYPTEKKLIKLAEKRNVIKKSE